MSELQATVEFSVELYKFYNVDLFQRGFYQIRTTLRPSPKLSVTVEVTLPKVQRTDFVFPACVVNGSGVSKTFQILYRNEEVLLDDVVMFRAHILVDSHKIEETLEHADFSLLVELWFTEQSFGGAEQSGKIVCMSRRTLQLSFSPTRGLHYHLPVLFDYFHLAAVTLTIHGSLVALHQPYIKKTILHYVQSCTPRSAKPWLGGSQKLNFRQPQSTMETVFFGSMNGGSKCVGTGSRLAHARHVHQAVCSILLASYETLQARLREYTKLLPSWQQLKLETADCFQRFSNLSDLAKLVEVEEEFVALANSDIAQLCAENILLWQQFLQAFTLKDPVHQHLAQAHHHLRVKRFAEAFFVLDNPRQSAAGCYDANYQNYLTVSDMVRRSRYLATLPPLPVQCLELDGDIATMPIIFEDQYQDMAEFARRRSVAGRKAESEPFLNTAGVDAAKTESRISLPQQQEDCSCGISAILESRSHQIPRSTLLTQPAAHPALTALRQTRDQRLRHTGEVVTATLTLTPRGSNNAATSATIMLHHTLPTRASKSKSLDQLRTGEAETLPSRKKKVLSPVSSSAPNPTLSHRVTAAMARSTSSQLRREKSADNVVVPKLPGPLRNNLKEKLKNNLRLELKVANGNGVLTSPSTDSGDSAVGCRKMEQSASVPFNLCEPPQPTNGLAMKHSQSTVSMPSAGAVANDVLPPAGSFDSMPNLAAPAVLPSPALLPATSPVPAKLVPTKAMLDLAIPPGLPANDKAKLEIGLYGSTDATLISVESSLAEVLKSKSLSSPPSSSLSEITSEQSGWVSNSSRRTSGDMSSGQLSPESDRPLRGLKPKPVKPQRDLNNEQLRDRLEELAEPSTAVDHAYEELHLPPPKQFRDVPPPPEPFRDPPVPARTSRALTEPLEPIDNLLYHVYESVKEVERRNDEKSRLKGRRKARDKRSKKSPSPKASDAAGSSPSGPPPTAATPTAGTERGTPACECYDDAEQKMVAAVKDETVSFVKSKEDFKRQVNFTGMLYSDFPTLASTLPYFHISDEYRVFSPEGLHLIVCVHGLDGNSADLRLVKTYLELGLPGANLEFLMSERNQGDTFSDFDTMTDKLVAEILYHVEACGLNPTKISFVGHSLGNIIIRAAVARPQMKHLLPRLHTFLSLSGPHLGTLYNNSGLVNMGMWFMQKWKKSGSLLQLSLRDATDVRQSFLYRLSQRSNLHHFRNLLLCGSSQDRYVPLHSARIELCKAAVKDSTVQGAVYREMVNNILQPIISKPELTFVRYDVHHALPNTANSLIGRAAHIAVLDSELFIEKFLVVTGLKYFR